MGKNKPDNIAPRVSSEGEEVRVESRYFSGSDARSVEAIAANMGDWGGSRREKSIEARGGAVRLTPVRNGGVDFGDAIGKELQSIYDDVVAQPVPDRFLNLLTMLEKNMLPSGGGK